MKPRLQSFSCTKLFPQPSESTLPNHEPVPLMVRQATSQAWCSSWMTSRPSGHSTGRGRRRGGPTQPPSPLTLSSPPTLTRAGSVRLASESTPCSVLRTGTAMSSPAQTTGSSIRYIPSPKNLVAQKYTQQRIFSSPCYDCYCIQGKLKINKYSRKN